MPRIPYVSSSIPGDIPNAIRTRRSGALLELDRTLLHNPSVAAGWNALLSSIRSQTTIPGQLRELVICHVAVLNAAEYEWSQHAPVALALGVPQASLDALKAGALEVFSDTEKLVLEFATRMTLDVHVPDELFERVREVLGDDQVHDLVATVATYNMVSRYLVALKVGF